MGRMMPGRVRAQGIGLYEEGQVEVRHLEAGRLFLRIAGEEFCYSPEDEEVTCTCISFRQHQYCIHLAATEYFLKNDSQGKDYEKSLLGSSTLSTPVQVEKSLGARFLDSFLLEREKDSPLYMLSVEGQLVLFDSNIDWTLKITRLPDQRSYIIRDVVGFLKTVKKGGHYQVGKHYYERITFSQFDEASQDVIAFLWQLMPQFNLTASEVFSQYGRHLRLPLASFELGVSLLQDLSQFSWTYDGRTYSELQVLQLHSGAPFFEVRVTEQTSGFELEVGEQSHRKLFDGAYVLDGAYCYAVSPEQARILASLTGIPEVNRGKRKIVIDEGDKARLAVTLLECQKIGQVFAPDSLLLKEFQAQFFFFLTDKEEVALQLTLQIDQQTVTSDQDLLNVPFAIDYRPLEAIFSLLKQSGFHGRFYASHARFEPEDTYLFFSKLLPACRKFGQVRLAPEIEALRLPQDISLRVDREGSLLAISFDVAGIAPDEIEEALEALLSKASYFASRTGKILLFEEESQKISQTLLDLRAQHAGQGKLQLDVLASYQLQSALEDRTGVAFSESFQQLAYDLLHPEETVLPSVPVTASLRDYQVLGVKWLTMLASYGFGGILADEMGLGKTLQTIAFLAANLKEEQRALVLAPSSLIYNWQEELARFAPDLAVSVIYGSKEAREQQLAQSAQITVTSYAAFRNDKESYQSTYYDYLILDEAQTMKNDQTKLAQYLRDCQFGSCFALSGTPIENHLQEIWSIFQIVLPGLLPTKTNFAKLEPAAVARYIQPFILRRKKEDVLEELPDLLEMTVYNELSEEQKALYLAQIQQIEERFKTSSEADLNRHKIEILSAITRLRQICDSPSLFLPDYQGSSGKLDSLRELLFQLKEGGHRVLIFSQFKYMLTMIGEVLEELGMTSYTLTGSTPAPLRQEMTTDFNQGNRDAFLISLKAGGVGLNLTGADRVILVDLWWNPATESQAISRAHRMGQTETVEVYRLITRGTIEERILALQESKKHLVTTVLDGHESRASLTLQDIRDILGIS